MSLEPADGNPAPYRCKHDCERDELKDRIAALEAEVARKDEALRAALEELYAPEAGCSCHISPPCFDCVEYSSIRSTQDLIRAALEARP